MGLLSVETRTEIWQEYCLDGDCPLERPRNMGSWGERLTSHYKIHGVYLKRFWIYCIILAKNKQTFMTPLIMKRSKLCNINFVQQHMDTDTNAK